ncbi:MAG: hypothetical protein A2X31_06990 [Elusimicrobia bacterium GWB2_63_22]|nr:MAG: hypothetical protein A2X31_06990 [Elusimicrobia bacterium GWB2_63_22]
MKNILEQVGFIILGILLILGGLQVISHGALETASASGSVHQFNGIERLMGLLPIIFGSVVAYVSFLKLKKTKIKD